MSTRHISQRGFTMIELAVTMSIFAVLVSVVFTNYRSFSSGAEFTNIGEDLVLALREAQIYGLGSKGAGVGVNCDIGGVLSPFNCAYGVYLSSGSTENASYKIFIDKNNNGVYDAANDSLVRTVDFGSKAKILSIACEPATTSCSSSASVTFKRPSPDAIIKSQIADSAASSVVVTLQNQDASKLEAITVTQTGQVSLKKR